VIPRFRPVLGFAELAAALRPAQSDDVERFEAAFARAVGQRYAVAFPYGRTGLLALLSALGIKGREVICPAYTCVVVPHAIAIGGNAPAFVDAGADANMDFALAERAIGPDTGALIATSVFGNPVDLDHLDAIARRNPQLVVIQDCAHSFTAEWKGRRVNQAGRAAIFGLNASKTMTSIFGGMVTTDDPELAAALIAEKSRLVAPAPLLKSVRRTLYLLALYAAFWPPLFGLTEQLRHAGLLDRFTRYYDENVIDMPRDYLVALSPVEARVGIVQARRLDAFIDARRTYANYYRRALSQEPALAWIGGAEGCSYSHVAARVANRGHVMRAAALHGIQLGEVIEYSVPEMAAYRKWGNVQGPFPVAHALARETINLPVSGRFDEHTAARTAAVLKQILADQPAPSTLRGASS
jgi:dTDP-4-amino-4,6-dideoxygalactose transaminase